MTSRLSTTIIILLCILSTFRCKPGANRSDSADSMADTVADTVAVAPKPEELFPMRLPSGWTMNVPKPMLDTLLNSYEEEFGIMIDTSTMLFLEYHCGIHEREIRPCDSASNTEFARRCASAWNEEYPFGTLHTMDVDSVGTRIGVFASPLVDGEGDFAVEVSDCESGAWIQFKQPAATAVQQQLLRVMFATLDYNAEK